MLLILDKEKYNANSIYFGDKSKNNIIDNSFFYNITYVTPSFVIQQLHIKFELNNLSLIPYYNKYKINLKDNNNTTLKYLTYIESSILESFKTTKTHIYKLQSQVHNNELKCISNIEISNKIYQQCDFLIKISGIWEN